MHGGFYLHFFPATDFAFLGFATRCVCGFWYNLRTYIAGGLIVRISAGGGLSFHLRRWGAVIPPFHRLLGAGLWTLGAHILRPQLVPFVIVVRATCPSETPAAAFFSISSAIQTALLSLPTSCHTFAVTLFFLPSHLLDPLELCVRTRC